jgi:hypothetical protein
LRAARFGKRRDEESPARGYSQGLHDQRERFNSGNFQVTLRPHCNEQRFIFERWRNG